MKMRLTIHTFDLASTERLLCCEALTAAGTIVEAAKLLGITRHALKRRIVKHEIEWPRPKFGPNSLAAAQAAQATRLGENAPVASPQTLAPSPTTPALAAPTTQVNAAPRPTMAPRLSMPLSGLSPRIVNGD